MRALISTLMTVFILAGCSSYEQDYRQVDHYSGSRYSGSDYRGNDSYYSADSGVYSGSSTTVYASTNYSYYYPFGNVSYPRDRIWIIGSYGSCNYYSYRGYCYRYRNDYDRVIVWDRKHGYDDHWYRNRQDWCRRNDCYRDHVVRDGKGRPIVPPRVERDGMQRAPQHPRQQYPNYQNHNRSPSVDRRGTDSRRDYDRDRDNRRGDYNRNHDDNRDRDYNRNHDDSRRDDSRDRSSARSWDARQPVERGSSQPVIRNTRSGWQQDQSSSSSQQPVIRNTRSGWQQDQSSASSQQPVIRNTRSGWQQDRSSSSNQQPAQRGMPSASNSGDSARASRSRGQESRQGSWGGRSSDATPSEEQQ